jgi:acetyltransferase-like isoleucine patch superfamily enzyme
MWLFLRRRVTGKIKLRGDAGLLWIDPSFRCDGDLWLGVYAPEGRITLEAGVSASGPLTITAIRPLRVGAGTLFGPNVFVSDHYHGNRRDPEHMAQSPSFRPLHTPGAVDIGRDVLLGVNAAVLAPAKVGDRSIVAANAVVKGEVAANSVYIGIPSTSRRS